MYIYTTLLISAIPCKNTGFCASNSANDIAIFLCISTNTLGRMLGAGAGVVVGCGVSAGEVGAVVVVSAVVVVCATGVVGAVVVVGATVVICTVVVVGVAVEVGAVVVVGAGVVVGASVVKMRGGTMEFCWRATAVCTSTRPCSEATVTKAIEVAHRMMPSKC